jgi:hypothetical protein
MLSKDEDWFFFPVRQSMLWEPESFVKYFDADQRRMRQINGFLDQFPPFEYKEMPVISRHHDSLSPSVHTYTVDKDGLVVSTSTDEKDDPTMFVPYPRFSDCESLADCKTIKYSELTELNRLGRETDKCCYKDEAGVLQNVVFKYNCLYHTERRRRHWFEMHILKHVQGHPNILPLDRVVLEDVESRVIGFTTPFICGGTFKERRDTLFRFEWLEQLTSTLDFLNLELGVMHQDIAPRNLLVHPDTNALIVFDFNAAASSRGGWAIDHLDVDWAYGAVYEIITAILRDEAMVHVAELQKLPDWPLSRELDRDVSDFRNFLDEWVAKRSANGGVTACFKRAPQIGWPALQEAEDLPYKDGSKVDKDGMPVLRYGMRTRYDAIKNGQYVFRWERPPKRQPKRFEIFDMPVQGTPQTDERSAKRRRESSPESKAAKY